MEPFNGNIDGLLEKISKLSIEELDQIEADCEKSASVSFISDKLGCSHEEGEQILNFISEVKITKVLEELIKDGKVYVCGVDENGENLYALRK